MRYQVGQAGRLRKRYRNAGEHEFTSYGVSLVQNFNKIGTDFYLGARNHELDQAGSNFDDVFAILGGARVKF